MVKILRWVAFLPAAFLALMIVRYGLSVTMQGFMTVVVGIKLFNYLINLFVSAFGGMTYMWTGARVAPGHPTTAYPILLTGLVLFWMFFDYVITKGRWEDMPASFFMLVGAVVFTKIYPIENFNKSAASRLLE